MSPLRRARKKGPGYASSVRSMTILSDGSRRTSHSPQRSLVPAFAGTLITTSDTMRTIVSGMTDVSESMLQQLSPPSLVRSFYQAWGEPQCGHSTEVETAAANANPHTHT
jgi:hypothetical protein